MPVQFILDYAKQKYILIQGPLHQNLGYRAEEFLEGGIPFLRHIIHPDDFKLKDNCVFPTNGALIRSLAPADLSRHIFSYNFRLRDARGSCVTVLQKGCYLADEESGLPRYSFGSVVNISAFKRDASIVHTVDRLDHGGEINRVISECYYGLPDSNTLTHREREVLRWLSEGLSGKQLAGKLKMAENTVANHRKALLRKTGAKNMAELVHFGFKHGLI